MGMAGLKTPFEIISPGCFTCLHCVVLTTDSSVWLSVGISLWTVRINICFVVLLSSFPLFKEQRFQAQVSSLCE